MAKNYILLEELIAGWSSQSGELPEVVLTQICDQDSRGRFPPGTFRHRSTGESSSPGALAEVVRAARSSAYSFIRNEAAEALVDIVVSKEGVREYCSKYDVRPPLCATSYLKWLVLRRARYAAPPRYPSTPEEIANEQVRSENEEAVAAAAYFVSLENSVNDGLNGLEGTLTSLRSISNRLRKDGASYWLDTWSQQKFFIESDLEALPKGERRIELENRLSELEAEFQTLISTKPCEAAGEPQPRVRPTAAAETQAKRYLEEQVYNKRWQPKDVHFRQAKERIGESLSKRAFLRAWNKTVPDEWRKRGRPRQLNS